MFHFNHNWSYYGIKSKWTFKGNAIKNEFSVDLFPERKCMACSRMEQLESVVDLPIEGLRKSWVHIYQSKYEKDPLLDAVRKIYYAGKWSCPDVKELDAGGLWADLRDAAGFEPGGTSK